MNNQKAEAPKTLLNEQTMRWIIRVYTILALLAIIAVVSIDIYTLSELPIAKDNKQVKKLTVGMELGGLVLGSLPLLGVIIKYTLSISSKYEWSKSAWYDYPQRIMRDILKMERKTRLVTGWLAIFLLISHFIYYGSLIDSNLVRYDWELKPIMGTTAVALLIAMNLNGFIMLGLRKRNKGLKWIKPIGYTNLVFGLTFLALALAHIFV